MNNAATEPVRLTQNTAPALLDKIDLKMTHASLTLTFWPIQAEPSTLTLNLEQTQQLLGILHQQYCLAEWPLHAWPDWITDEPKKSSPFAQHAQVH